MDEKTGKRRILTCVYCGKEYPQATPAWGDKVLTDHIKTCEKHPMKMLYENYTKVRKALVGLVGVDGVRELDQMEATIISLSVGGETQNSIIKAIKALRETIEV